MDPEGEERQNHHFGYQEAVEIQSMRHLKEKQSFVRMMLEWNMYYDDLLKESHVSCTILLECNIII
jgi:hypothetical protein